MKKKATANPAQGTEHSTADYKMGNTEFNNSKITLKLKSRLKEYVLSVFISLGFTGYFIYRTATLEAGLRMFKGTVFLDHQASLFLFGATTTFFLLLTAQAIYYILSVKKSPPTIIHDKNILTIPGGLFNKYQPISIEINKIAALKTSKNNGWKRLHIKAQTSKGLKKFEIKQELFENKDEFDRLIQNIQLQIALIKHAETFNHIIKNNNEIIALIENIKPTQKPDDPAQRAMQRTFDEKKKENPLIQVQLAAQNVVNHIGQAMAKADASGKGVHTESLLTILASLAGFASQMAVRVAIIDSEHFNKVTDPYAFLEMGTKDGKKFYFGNLLNGPLLESNFSVYALTCGALHSLGKNKFPDIQEIAKHTSQSVGSENFGVPRIPEGGHAAGDLPINYLKSFWPIYHPLLLSECDEPQQWPILFGIAIQNVITQAKDVLDPEIAAQIVMETAIPMSKVDPREIFTQSTQTEEGLKAAS